MLQAFTILIIVRLCRSEPYRTDLEVYKFQCLRVSQPEPVNLQTAETFSAVQVCDTETSSAQAPQKFHTYSSVRLIKIFLTIHQRLFTIHDVIPFSNFLQDYLSLLLLPGNLLLSTQ